MALAVFLFTYRGYRNEHHWKDLLAAFVAGAAALLVAVFPTNASPIGVAPPLWWRPWMGTLHLAAAGVLFISFIVFSVILFPLPHQEGGSGKKWRKRVYYLCGAGMAVCVLNIALHNGQADPIFWPESVALELFALSWFAKARADWTLGQIRKKLFGMRRH